MTGTRVPFFAHFRQIPLTLIAIFSCTLSFWLTVRFCGELSPGHASLEISAMGMVWELSKLTFGASGAHRLTRGAAVQRPLGYLLVSMSLVLALGSVVASLAFLRQTDQHLSAQALQTSEAYQRGTAQLAAIERDMQTLSALASQDAAAQKYRARSLGTLDRVAALRAESAKVAQALTRLETSSSTGTGSRATTTPLVLGGWVSAEALRTCAQCVLATMLELVSIVAMGLLAATDERTQPTAGPRPLYLVRSSDPPPGSRTRQGSIAPRDAPEERYARAKTLVGTAKLKPNYRAVQKALDVSQPTALHFLRAMAAEGLLRREGRGYALTHAEVSGGAA